MCVPVCAWACVCVLAEGGRSVQASVSAWKSSTLRERLVSLSSTWGGCPHVTTPIPIHLISHHPAGYRQACPGGGAWGVARWCGQGRGQCREVRTCLVSHASSPKNLRRKDSLNGLSVRFLFHSCISLNLHLYLSLFPP